MLNDRNGTQELDSGSFAGELDAQEIEAQGSTWAGIRQTLQIITTFRLLCFDFLNLHRNGF